LNLFHGWNRMKIFFSVGEPSGDLHGANLIRQLQQRMPGIETTGFGGYRMEEAGCDLLQDMTELAVMGLGPVLAKLPKFFELRRLAKEVFNRDRPDAVVLIDYPGFNWHIARAAKERGIPVVYYGLPQLWAWASWRVKKVQSYVDHALCKLPFEEGWFRDRGCSATYVGHPYFDELRSQQPDQAFQAKLRSHAGRLVTLLPGSRSQEVKNNLPMLLKSAQLIRREVPDAYFAIASYNGKQAAMAQQMAADIQLPLETHVGRTCELIREAHTCLACSGSVSLELLYHTKPSVIIYKVPWVTYTVVRRALLNVKYFTLVNLLAMDEIHPRDLSEYEPNVPGHENVLYPEYATYQDRSSDVAAHAVQWLNDPIAHRAIVARLQALRDKLTAGSASATAADYICGVLKDQVSCANGNRASRSAA
jgi:lipid-A-disaccharide synthase